ncbi:hypothetical protein ACQ4M3_34290 [Leptolyngbya sp. AN03gr2]|uniref:hypothetical protein n=1 Tax=unclassified Leptolyngbya TaxID=2650499 RepID=UPI003D31BAA7
MRIFYLPLTIVATLSIFMSESRLALAGSESGVPTVESSEAATGATTSSTTSAPTSSTVNASTNSQSINQPINQQNGVIQVTNSGLSNLTYPNCGGSCAFAIGRVISNSNGTSGMEAVAGVVFQFRSPENTQADAFKLTAQAQADHLQQETTATLAEKLAEALESGKMERANIFAMILSQRLGYTDYQKLMEQIRTKRF